MNNDISMVSDSQAEGCLLASIIAHPEFIFHIEFLQPGQFYNVENGCLYWAIQQLTQNGVMNIDAINLSNAIKSNSAIKKKIEEYNIGDLQDFIDTSAYAARDTLEEVKLLARSITTMAYKRDLNRFSLQVQRNCCDGKMSLNDLSKFVNDGIDSLSEKYVISCELQRYGDKADDIWQEIVNRRTEDGLTGIPFKFDSLNSYITLESSELVVVGARMKRGKSALLLNQALFALKNDIPTAFIDTEMIDRLFHERLLANISGVPINKIKRGYYTYDEGKVIQKAHEWIKSKPFYHLYLPDHTNEELYSIHKNLKNKIGLELSIFDYIKSNVTSTSENYNILGAKVDFLKNNICGALDIAMLSAVQLSRENQVADSDKIARHLTSLLIWEPKTDEEIAKDGAECGNYKLRVDLNRLGAAMEEDEYIDIQFDKEVMRIVEANKHEEHVENDPFAEENNEQVQ